MIESKYLGSEQSEKTLVEMRNGGGKPGALPPMSPSKQKKNKLPKEEHLLCGGITGFRGLRMPSGANFAASRRCPTDGGPFGGPPASRPGRTLSGRQGLPVTTWAGFSRETRQPRMFLKRNPLSVLESRSRFLNTNPIPIKGPLCRWKRHGLDRCALIRKPV